MHRCIADTSNIDEAVEASGGKKLKWSSRRNILQNALENTRFEKTNKMSQLGRWPTGSYFGHISINFSTLKYLIFNHLITWLL